MKEVQLKEVIITTLSRAGTGRPEDPIREVTQIWDKDGTLIAERDEHFISKMAEPQQHLGHIDDHAKCSGNLYFSNEEDPAAKKTNDTDQEPEEVAKFPRNIGRTDGSIVRHGTMKWYELAHMHLMGKLEKTQDINSHEKLLKELKWTSKKIQEMEKGELEENDIEPEILAGFERDLSGSVYPAEEWYIKVYHKLSKILRNEPEGSRQSILLNTLSWLSNKIHHHFNE